MMIPAWYFFISVVNSGMSVIAIGCLARMRSDFFFNYAILCNLQYILIKLYLKKLKKVMPLKTMILMTNC